MDVAYDRNDKIFPITFSLVEGETSGVWSFFLKNLTAYVTRQLNLCLIYDRHEYIKSSYNNLEKWLTRYFIYTCVLYQTHEQNFMWDIKDKELCKKLLTWVTILFILNTIIFTNIFELIFLKVAIYDMH